MDGIRKTVGMYLDESDDVVRLAVGETGQIQVSVVFQMERGRVQWTKGGCHWERRVSFRGG